MSKMPRTRWMGAGLGLWVVLALISGSSARADSIPTNTDPDAGNSMKAFVNPYGVVIELQLDPAQAELALPRLIRRATKAEFLPTPTPRRSELRVKADGKILAGWVETFIKHKRVTRDPITGKPLDEPRDDDVLFMRLRYPFPSRPEELELSPPLDASGQPSVPLGFVAFHEGVPVNDFAPMTAAETLRLDWDDPFYSRFSRAAIGRKHEAPLSVFVYVEPHEVRAEIVGRVMDFAPFLELELEPDEEIPAEAREEMLAKIAWLLERNATLEVDGTDRDPSLDRIHFISRDLHAGNLLTAEQRAPAKSATVAAIFVYPVPGLPQEVRLRWELFGEHLAEVSASATDESEATLHVLTPEHAELRWVNDEGRVARPAKLEVSAPLSRVQVPVVLGFGCLLALALAAIAIRQRSGWLALGAIAFFALGWTARSLATYTLVVSPHLRAPTGSEAAPTIEALVYNVYRAMDGPQDSGAHAKLGASVSESIVDSIYRDIVPSLRLDDHHGSRLRIHEVQVLDAQPVDAPGKSDISYRCKWLSRGSVGHWGHLHERTTAHDGVITLAPEEGRWKIARLDILSSEPLR